MSDENINQFCAITGADVDRAKALLAACNGNLEMAINMQMEGGDEPGPSANAQNNHQEEEEVRAPIPQRREVLVEEEYEPRPQRQAASSFAFPRCRVTTVTDGFRNFSAEGFQFAERDANSLPVSESKKNMLEQLFKPPLDLMHKGDWQSARTAATDAKKWLMVNVQDSKEFVCQTLNRDVWSHPAVKAIVDKNFVFWQQYRETSDAQRYINFYKVTDWPHVAVLDPRTGESLVTWSKIPDADCFCSLVTEFMSTYPSLSADSSEPPKKRSRPNDDSILDENEDAQMAAAIKASLAEQAKSKAEAAGESSDSDEVESFSPEEDSNLSTSDALSKVPASNHSEKPWTDYLGDEGDEKSQLLIRFPDGKREKKDLPCSSQLKAILRYIEEAGFPLAKYEIITNFPKRVLSELDEARSLKDVGLFPKETVFVQQRSS